MIVSEEKAKPLWETEKDKEYFEETLREIIGKVMEQGQLIVPATKQHGKTNAVMWLLRYLRGSQEHEENRIKLMMFDTVLNFRYKFDAVPFVDIAKIRHIPLAQDLIIDIPYTSTKLTKDTITQILMEDFVNKRKLKEKFKGENPYYNVYVVEEMHNVWGTYGLTGNNGEFALKIFSECANYDMIMIGITQRLADVSTKIIERSRYLLVGALSGDNDTAKLKRITNKKLIERVKNLKRGEFIFIDRDNPEYVKEIYFPKFEQVGEPHEYTNGYNGSGYVKKVFIG